MYRLILLQYTKQVLNQNVSNKKIITDHSAKQSHVSSHFSLISRGNFQKPFMAVIQFPPYETIPPCIGMKPVGNSATSVIIIYMQMKSIKISKQHNQWKEAKNDLSGLLVVDYPEVVQDKPSLVQSTPVRSNEEWIQKLLLTKLISSQQISLL